MSRTFKKKLINLTEAFNNKLNKIHFSFTGIIYNPLDYAKDNYYEYLQNYVNEYIDNIFLGMNPGPYGMVQTGIPFGEINYVKNYLKINNTVNKPKTEHCKKIITGMNTERSEISGFRFWSLIKSKYQTAELFAEKNAVLNYCPLCFIENTQKGKNITPEMLSKSDKNQINICCDEYLKNIIMLIQPKKLIGIGSYAYKRFCKVSTLPTFYMLHPSPLNPKANKNWIENEKNFLIENGIWSDDIQK